MNFTKILCPTDFSPGAESALRAATRLAIAHRAELVIVHAWQIPAISYSIEASLPPSLAQEIVDSAQRGLDAAVRDAQAQGATFVSGKLLPGIAWAEIVGQLEREAYDLCVIGTHGRTGLGRVLLGSVAEKVVRHAPCPVLVVRPNNDVKTFQHVLVPTDFSTSAAYALELAPQLVEPKGTITVLHVLELPVSYAGEISAEFGKDLSKKAAARLEQTLASLRTSTTASIETRTRIGSPGSQALAAVEDDRSIDLVIVGSRGRTGIKRVLLGSVAEKIVRHAHCPVLVAHRRS
jgi:nucleotide-binding universal stress UspA family protein